MPDIETALFDRQPTSLFELNLQEIAAAEAQVRVMSVVGLCFGAVANYLAVLGVDAPAPGAGGCVLPRTDPVGPAQNPRPRTGGRAGLSPAGETLTPGRTTASRGETRPPGAIPVELYAAGRQNGGLACDVERSESLRGSGVAGWLPVPVLLRGARTEVGAGGLVIWLCYHAGRSSVASAKGNPRRRVAGEQSVLGDGVEAGRVEAVTPEPQSVAGGRCVGTAQGVGG